MDDTFFARLWANLNYRYGLLVLFFTVSWFCIFAWERGRDAVRGRASLILLVCLLQAFILASILTVWASIEPDEASIAVAFAGVSVHSFAKGDGVAAVRGRGIFAVLVPALGGLAILRPPPGSAPDSAPEPVPEAVARIALLFLPLLALFSLAASKLRKVLSGRRGKPDPLPPAGPFFLPCRTTHSRAFPTRHGFGYSYLQVAVPVGWAGSVGSVLAIDKDSAAGGADGLSRWRHWFTVEAGDHLFRGRQEVGLRGKLAAYLESEGRDLSTEYDDAWLVTAPRFLGYAFNPVSFWYLYKAGVLKSMVLEVNNTFDERRMYFMDTQAAESGEKHRAAWPKDFHVSPFCSRKGSYTLSAMPPAFASGRGIDNTLTLLSSKAHAKIVARLHSASAPIDARTLAPLQPRLQFLARWWWVGFLTFPRIAAQATALYFRRGLHVWYRPEVLPGSMARTATAREAAIECCWRRYLKGLAECSGTAITYVSAGIAAPREERFAPLDPDQPPLRLEVLTPQFYADLAAAPSVAGYLAASAAQPPERRSLAASDLQQLIGLVRGGHGVFVDRGAPPRKWRWVAALRRAEPGAPQRAQPATAPPEKGPAPDTQPAGKLHALDEFAREFLLPDDEEAYRRAARAAVLTRLLAFGVPALYEAAAALALPLACSAVTFAVAEALLGIARYPVPCMASAYLAALWASWLRSRGMPKGEIRILTGEEEQRWTEAEKAEKTEREKIGDEEKFPR